MTGVPGKIPCSSGEKEPRVDQGGISCCRFRSLHQLDDLESSIALGRTPPPPAFQKWDARYSRSVRRTEGRSGRQTS